MTYDKNSIEEQLSPHDRKRCFEACHFDFSNGSLGSMGWFNSVLGAPELGEGEQPNFSVNLESGAVKDHGSSGYTGDLYSVVQDVHAYSFLEALEWISTLCGISGDTVRLHGDGAWTSDLSDELAIDIESMPPGHNDDSSQGGSSESPTDHVATPGDVQKWHDRLMGEESEAEAARTYLIEKRGLDQSILRKARIGLVQKQGRYEDTFVGWWIVIPATRRSEETGENSEVVAVKRFAFDPVSVDWQRNHKRRKIARNTESGLYDYVSRPDQPVVVCEGEMDALCAHKHGFNTVTGTNGALTFRPDWAAYIAELTAAIDHGAVVCYDGDDAGRKGASKAASKLAETGLKVRIAKLPDGQDVNDILLSDGSEALANHIQKAIPYEPPRAGQSAVSVADSEHTGWAEPIPFHEDCSPAPFPVEVFPSWLEAHVESVASFVQVPRDLPALLGLCVASSALQKKAVVEPRPGWTVPLTLWGAGVLESGTRKSPTFKHMNGPIEEHERELRRDIEEEHKAALDKSEILQKRLDRAKKEAVKAREENERYAAESDVQTARKELERHTVPTHPQLWIDDTTSEALLRALSNNEGRMLAMSPEGDLFKYMAGRYDSSSSVLNVYKKAWTGEEAARDNRISREGISVPNPALAVAICVQPQVLEDLAQKRTFRGEGLMARFLYAVPTSMVGRRKTGSAVPPLNQAAARGYERGLKHLLDLEPLDISDGEYVPHVLRLTKPAQGVLGDFEGYVEEELRPGGRLDGIKDWGSKLVGQALRITGVLHVAQKQSFDSEISAGTMLNGVRVAHRTIDHTHAAYGLLNAHGKTRLARYVWRRIRETLDLPSNSQNSRYAQNGHVPIGEGSSANSANSAEASLTKRDLFEAVKGKSEISSVSDLDPVLAQLETHHLIRIVQECTEGPGRPPSPHIFVNPLTYINN